MEYDFMLKMPIDWNSKEFLDYLSKELEEAEKQIENGECVPLEEVEEYFKEKYNNRLQDTINY